MYKTGQTVVGAVLALALATPAAAIDIAVPSGQPVTLAEVLTDENPGELWLRFRFVAPEISRDGGSVDHETAASDLDWLCENLVLPYLASRDLHPVRVILSLADRPVRFGVSDPDATQFFETYRPEGDRCMWEEF